MSLSLHSLKRVWFPFMLTEEKKRLNSWADCFSSREIIRGQNIDACGGYCVITVRRFRPRDVVKQPIKSHENYNSPFMENRTILAGIPRSKENLENTILSLSPLDSWLVEKKLRSKIYNHEFTRQRQ